MDRSLGENISPDAGALSESLRDFGYTLPRALADLIDNSITAGAGKVSLTVEHYGPEPHIAAVDDGSGMTEEQLVQAMRLGTTGPLGVRSAADLGRFGLGMKTASLSQGRSLTVVTKTSTGTVSRKWDLDHVKKSGWELRKDLSKTAQRYATDLAEQKTGTAVVIEKLDRTRHGNHSGEDAQHHLAAVLNDVRSQLAMVFHQFIADGLRLWLGATQLGPWDPFLSDKSTRLPEETVAYKGEHIKVCPFVLPHHSRLTDDEYERAEGPRGWNAHQGFYVYRNMRLVVPGTWLNLEKRSELYKLARIRVELPNSIDHDWHLNVMKSHVAVPAILRPTFQRIATDVRRQAAEVYRYRGERQVPTDSPPERYLWKRKQTKNGVRFKIDRTHPVVQALLHAGCQHEELLDRLLSMVEDTLPVSSILSEPARSLEGIPVHANGEQVPALVEMLSHAEQFLIRHGLTPKDAREKLLTSEPFARHRLAIQEQLS